MEGEHSTSGMVKAAAMFLPLSGFRELLEVASRRFPSKQAFAKAIGVTPSRFSRVLGGSYTLNVLNCLRLAKITGESASRVLRLAGKTEIAELIEEQYGRTAPALSPSERELLETWSSLNQRSRENLKGILKELPREPERERLQKRGR